MSAMDSFNSSTINTGKVSKQFEETIKGIVEEKIAAWTGEVVAEDIKGKIATKIEKKIVE